MLRLPAGMKTAGGYIRTDGKHLASLMRVFSATLHQSMIDELDARLIDTLTSHPRMALLEVARRLGVARGTVQARLAKLEARGVVASHGPVVDPGALGYPVCAHLQIDVEHGRIDEAVALLREMPEVLDVDAISGAHDLHCRIVAHDTDHLHRLIGSVRRHPAVRGCASQVVLAREVALRTGPLVALAGADHVGPHHAGPHHHGGGHNGGADAGRAHNGGGASSTRPADPGSS